MSRNMISRIEEANLYKLMEGKIRKCEDGFAEYEQDWSDIQIFEAFKAAYPQTKIHKSHVEGYRRDVWGQLRKKNLGKFTTNRIGSLEETVLRLIEWAAKRPKEPFVL